MTRWWRDERGQMVPAALLVLLLLAALAAAVLDVGQLLHVRQRVYQITADAALQGARAGAQYEAYVLGGAVTLDPVSATAQAQTVVIAGLHAAHITTYTVQIAVLADAGGGVVPGFPPVAQADATGAADWSSAEPAVGVYVAADVPTLWLHWILGTATVPVHAFSAAGIAQE